MLNMRDLSVEVPVPLYSLINTWYPSVVDFVSGSNILLPDDDHDTLDVKTLYYLLRNYLQL